LLGWLFSIFTLTTKQKQSNFNNRKFFYQRLLDVKLFDTKTTFLPDWILKTSRAKRPFVLKDNGVSTRMVLKDICLSGQLVFQKNLT